MNASVIPFSPRPLAAALVAASLSIAVPAALALERTEVQHENDVRFVTGGIGDMDQQRTRQLGKGMNLQLVFARADGSYLADVGVTVRDDGGKRLLELDAADPMLFAELPPGRYEVIADIEGQAIRRSVTVPEHGQRVEFFHWQMR